MDIRMGRDRGFVLHAHLVLGTKYRHHVFRGCIWSGWSIMGDDCADFGAGLREFIGKLTTLT